MASIGVFADTGVHLGISESYLCGLERRFRPLHLGAGHFQAGLARELLRFGGVILRFRCDPLLAQRLHPGQLPLGYIQRAVRFRKRRPGHGQIGVGLRHRLHIFPIIQLHHELAARHRVRQIHRESLDAPADLRRHHELRRGFKGPAEGATKHDGAVLDGGHLHRRGQFLTRRGPISQRCNPPRMDEPGEATACAYQDEKHEELFEPPPGAAP